MNAKSLGLAGFGVKPSQRNDVESPVSNDELTSKGNDVKKPGRGKGATVACTVRLSRNDWLKIQHLALDEGTTFQALAVAALDAELKRRGLPGFEG